MLQKLSSPDHKRLKALYFPSSGTKYLGLAVVSALILTACASHPPKKDTFSPQLLGMSESEWNSYDEASRNEIRANYEQISSANKAEDQANNDAARKQLSLAPAGETAGLAAPQSNVVTTNTVSPIFVKLSNGSALMPPFIDSHPFAPVTATISAGACEEIWLTTLDNNYRIALRACYKDKALALDPSRYELDQQDGTVTIPYSPLWDSGFTYGNVNSDGYVKLKNTVVTIKNISSS